MEGVEFCFAQDTATATFPRQWIGLSKLTIHFFNKKIKYRWPNCSHQAFHITTVCLFPKYSAVNKVPLAKTHQHLSTTYVNLLAKCWLVADWLTDIWYVCLNLVKSPWLTSHFSDFHSYRHVSCRFLPFYTDSNFTLWYKKVPRLISSDRSNQK